jgi:hypothetical protein
MILTMARLTDKAPVNDIKRMHDTVIIAALSGENLRPVLWVQPDPYLLIVRHDRALQSADFPVGHVMDIVHRPYWWPPVGAVIDWSVMVDAGQSGQTQAQWLRDVSAVETGILSAKILARGCPQPRRIRTPERMLELITDRFALVMDVRDAAVARHTPRRGHRHREGRVMWSNQVLLRGAGLVRDETGLHALMREGVGRHRAFGCGLILARPARGQSC